MITSTMLSLQRCILKECVNEWKINFDHADILRYEMLFTINLSKSFVFRGITYPFVTVFENQDEAESKRVLFYHNDKLVDILIDIDDEYLYSVGRKIPKTKDYVFQY